MYEYPNCECNCQSEENHFDYLAMQLNAEEFFAEHEQIELEKLYLF